MKKKLLCILMCIIMVASVMLTGCSNATTGDESETGTDTSSTKAMTVTLYSIKDDKTTAEAVAEVEAAINKITQGKFNTNIELRFYNESEYRDVILSKIELKAEEIKKEEEDAAAKKAAAKAARESAKAAAAAGITTKKAETTIPDEETTEAGDETYINEQGRELTVYPESTESQLDIFLVNSLDMLLELKDLEAMSTLDSELSVGAKKLNSYIYPTFLSSSKLEGSTYVIPNNHVIGEYEYILLNKELIDKYSYDASAMTTLDGIMDYLNDVIKHEPDVVPLLNKPEPLIRYWNIVANSDGTRAYLTAPDEFNILAAYVPGLPAESKYAPKPITTISQYQKYMAALKTLEDAGATPADTLDLNTDKTFAAAFIKGDITTPSLYEDKYYVSVYKSPVADNEEVFSAGYAIGAYTRDLTRTMEILTYINTNTEIANLLAYGVNNVNYTVNEDTGIIEKIAGSGYYMDTKYCGNQFMLTPSSDMSESMLALSANGWEQGKLQNQDSAADPYLGFYFSYEQDKVDENGNVTKATSTPVDKTAAALKALGEQYLAQIEAFEPYVNEENGKTIDIIAYLKSLKDEITANADMVEANNTDSEFSIVSQYNSWYETLHPST